MKILIIEDEPPIAEYISELCRSILKNQLQSIHSVYTFEDGKKYIKSNRIDLCLLDLNLNGKNGFDILHESVSDTFHTIVISAHIDQAIEAFQYGILDFVPKPVKAERLQDAFERFNGKLILKDEHKLKYIIVSKRNKKYLIPIVEISYFKADGYLIEIHTKKGSKELIEKPLKRLEQILPINFIRLHRSYIANLDFIDYYKHLKGTQYFVSMNDGTSLPLSASGYKKLKKHFLR